MLVLENKMGDLLVQASKHYFVFLYQEKWQRCKYHTLQLGREYIKQMIQSKWYNLLIIFPIHSHT